MKMIDAYFDAVTNFGALPFVASVLVVSFFAGANSLFWNLLWSFLATFILITIIKLLFFKHRPEHRGKSTKPRNLWERIDMSTFPSYHSAHSASMAILLSLHFNHLILTLFFILMALCVIASRVILKKHYVVDVVFGTLFGLVATAAVLLTGPALSYFL